MKQLLLKVVTVAIALNAMLLANAADGDEFAWQGLRYTVLRESNKTCEVNGFQNNSGYEISGDLIIPETVYNKGTAYTVEWVGADAFHGDHRIKSVKFAESITAVQKKAFMDCPNLTSVTFDNSMKTINLMAFSYCPKLTSIDLCNATAYGVAFMGCENLTTVTIGEKGGFGGEAFMDCYNLKNINVAAENRLIYSEDGVVFIDSSHKKVLKRCPPGREGQYEIPDGVELITDYAFFGCRKLNAVSIPNSVTTIKSCAFGEMTIQSLFIPESVIKIEDKAFTSDDGISATYELKEINVAPTNPKYTSIQGVVFSKDGKTLLHCPTGYSGHYILPENVIKIGWEAFFCCGNLTAVTLPESVNNISPWAFIGCINIENLYLKPKNPPLLDSDSFGQMFDIPVHVPVGCADAYRQDKEWGKFTNIIDDLAGIESVETGINKSQAVEVYNLLGVKVASSTDNLTPGIYIVRQGAGTKKILIK